MKSLILALSLLIVGCTTPAKTEIVYENKYIVRTASDDMKKVPPVPSTDDVKTDEDLAIWITQIDEYIVLLTDRIERLILFYEKPIE